MTSIFFESMKFTILKESTQDAQLRIRSLDQLSRKDQGASTVTTKLRHCIQPSVAASDKIKSVDPELDSKAVTFEHIFRVD